MAANSKQELMCITDVTGYQYDLSILPARDSPLIINSSQEILQEMQVKSIIQNLENVANLIYIAYNAVAGTMVQSQLTGIQKKYLDLLDNSGQAIRTFGTRSKGICESVVKAYQWLIKGKESMAVAEFNKCVKSSEIMAAESDALVVGFTELSNITTEALKSTQKEQILKYQDMDAMQAQMEKFNSQLKKSESLRDTLEEDIRSINKVYEDARKREKEAMGMKKGMMIASIVTTALGAIIPSVSSLTGKGPAGGTGSGSDNSKAAQATQSQIDEDENKKKQLERTIQEDAAQLDALKEDKAKLQCEMDEIKKNIDIQQGLTAKTQEEREAAVKELNEQLAVKQQAYDKNADEIKTLQGKMQAKQTEVDALVSGLDKLNKQLEKFMQSCQDDAQRASQAAEKALENKWALERERRSTLASIQEFTILIQSSVRQRNEAETAVKTLMIAITCIKQVIVALTTAAKFWRSLRDYCLLLTETGLGSEIATLSIGLTAEERLEYYLEQDFQMSFLVYLSRWAALYFVCDDYKKQNDKVRGQVVDNFLHTGTREEEWALAAKLAGNLYNNINIQVRELETITVQ